MLERSKCGQSSIIPYLEIRYHGFLASERLGEVHEGLKDQAIVRV